MKKKIIAYAVVPAVLGFSLLSTSVASAHGMMGGLGGISQNLSPDQLVKRQQDMFQHEAEMLGISVDEVKDAWSKGVSARQLIKDKNLDVAAIEKRMQDARAAQMKTQLQSLVTQGVITPAQADSRLQFMQTHLADKKGRHMGRGLLF